MAEKQLAIYECVIDNEVGSEIEVSMISLVDKPAIEKNFLAFAKAQQEARLKFKIDSDRKIISGPAMIADMLIYRKDDKPGGLGEYYTMFSKETIMSIAQKFAKKGFINNINLMHTDQKEEGVTVFESFVTDESRGVRPMVGFEDVADGTWFISMAVDNETIWNDVKEGKFKGFSVEGIFNQIPVKKKKKMSQEQFMEAVKSLLEQVED